jgi:AcrR family transcriptional regulator
MPSEYDPLFSGSRPGDDDIEPVRERFRAASRPYLRSPWSWFAWALLLPAVALLTPRAFRFAGPPGVLTAWSAAILIGGAVELVAILRSSARGARGTPLASWVLRVQGNLSLVALALSVLLVWQDLSWALPGLWLLLLGHSFYLLGGLAFEPFRVCGILYQVGGVVALWPGASPLPVFAAATALGNLWVGVSVWRHGKAQ